MSKFYDDVLMGSQVKELVKVLLEKSGYSVFPYGYESSLSDIKNKLRAKGTKNSRTVRMIRSTPDLLVYDKERKDIMFVEVKMRSAPKASRIKYLKIGWYQEFWKDSILIIVIPCGKVFYTQKILELENKQSYDATTDFKEINEIFTKVQIEDISHFKAKALKIMKK